MLLGACTLAQRHGGGGRQRELRVEARVRGRQPKRGGGWARRRRERRRTVGALHGVVQVADELVETLQLALWPAADAVPPTHLLEHGCADAERSCDERRRVGWLRRGGRVRSSAQREGEAHMPRRQSAGGRAARSHGCLATSWRAFAANAGTLSCQRRCRSNAATPRAARARESRLAGAGTGRAPRAAAAGLTRVYTGCRSGWKLVRPRRAHHSWAQAVVELSSVLCRASVCGMRRFAPARADGGGRAAQQPRAALRLARRRGGG